MSYLKLKLAAQKRIALVAHDNMKDDLLEWAGFNREQLTRHKLYGTGTTSHVLTKHLDLEITALMSGPLGGDQQIGAKIAEGEIDMLIFFWDPLEAQPHDPDIKALLRMAAVWNIPVASTRSTADFMISSPLMNLEYERLIVDHAGYQARLDD
jgi:methylglyoxal synthase